MRDYKTHPRKFCEFCSCELPFDYSYGFRAGFGNAGFLYNEAGNLSIWWSSFDEDYIAIVGEKHPWTLDRQEQMLIEDQLEPSANGDKWGFLYPARCPHCAEPISPPMSESIMGFSFNGKTDLSDDVVIPLCAYLKLKW